MDKRSLSFKNDLNKNSKIKIFAIESLPDHMNSELNPLPHPCDTTRGLVVPLHSFRTYKKALPLGQQNHLWALEV